ncbi:MAG TPA: hypothetical protein VEC75_05175, partial [Stellaceae bacterium]|nr:hypothetical protein [Stellaceae bacterium]
MGSGGKGSRRASASAARSFSIEQAALADYPGVAVLIDAAGKTHGLNPPGQELLAEISEAERSAMAALAAKSCERGVAALETINLGGNRAATVLPLGGGDA